MIKSKPMMIAVVSRLGALLLVFMLAVPSSVQAQASSDSLIFTGRGVVVPSSVRAQASSDSSKGRIQRHSIGIIPFSIQNFIESENSDSGRRSIDEYLSFTGIRYDFRITRRHGLTLQYDFGSKNSTYLGNLSETVRNIGLNVKVFSLGYKFQKTLSSRESALNPISYYINAGLARFAIFSDGLPGDRENITTTGGHLAFGYHFKMSTRAGASIEYSWRSSFGGESSSSGRALSNDLLHIQQGLNLVLTVDLF